MSFLLCSFFVIRCYKLANVWACPPSRIKASVQHQDGRGNSIPIVGKWSYIGDNCHPFLSTSGKPFFYEFLLFQFFISSYTNDCTFLHQESQHLPTIFHHQYRSPLGAFSTSTPITVHLSTFFRLRGFYGV